MAGKRRGRAGRWVERVALGAIMGAVAFVVERRLLRALRRRGAETSGPVTEPGGDAELAAAPKEIDQKPQR